MKCCGGAAAESIREMAVNHYDGAATHSVSWGCHLTVELKGIADEHLFGTAELTKSLMRQILQMVRQISILTKHLA